MKHTIVMPGAPIAFRINFNDGTSLSADEMVRVNLYTNRLINRLWANEGETNNQQITITRSEGGSAVDLSVTGEKALLLPAGFLKMELSVYEKDTGIIKRRYEKTILEIGTYYNGSTWDLELNDDVIIEEI